MEKQNFLQQFYQERKEYLAQQSDAKLIEILNGEANSRAWTGTRGTFLEALHLELESRFDCSMFINGNAMSLKGKFHLEGKKVIQVIDFPKEE